MKLSLHLMILLAVLAICASALAQNVTIDQLKQIMAESADNLTTYSYSRTGETSIHYNNTSISKEFSAAKTTLGEVDLVNQSGWWGSELKDLSTGENLTWEGYFINGSEFWNEDQSWTKFTVNNTSEVMDEYNELPGQVSLVDYSNVQITGTESLDGIECYKLVGSPVDQIYMGMIGLQMLAAFFPSPFALPEEIGNSSLDINDSALLNSSSIVLTAWVSKEDSLLRRLDINSSLVVTPQILNITAPDFRIESTMNESTTYMDFGSPVEIVLPAEALQNATFRMQGTDWRWAVFGSVRP